MKLTKIPLYHKMATNKKKSKGLKESMIGKMTLQYRLISELGSNFLAKIKLSKTENTNSFKLQRPASDLTENLYITSKQEFTKIGISLM